VIKIAHAKDFEAQSACAIDSVACASNVVAHASDFRFYGTSRDLVTKCHLPQVTGIYQWFYGKSQIKKLRTASFKGAGDESTITSHFIEELPLLA